MIKEFFQFFDFSVRKICSYLLRIVLVALTIVLYVLHSASISIYLVMVLIIAYLFIFHYFRNTRDNSTVRGISDLAFLAIALFFSDSDNMAKTLIFALVLIDYPNSSRDRYKWYESVGYLVLWGVALTVATHFSSLVELSLAVVGFAIFVVIYRARSKFMNSVEEIEARTVEFFEEVKEKGTPTSQEILRTVRDLATEYQPVKINEIHCFLLDDRILKILHSTSFIVNYTLRFSEDGLGPFNEETVTLIVDGIKVQHLYCIKIPTQAYTFVYVFDVSERILSLREKLFDKFIRKPLIFVSNVFAMNLDFDRKNVDLQDAYNLKVISLDAIYASTHYMKNNLSPLKGYVDSVGKFLSRHQDKNGVQDIEYLRANLEQVKKCLKDIEDYSFRVVEDTRMAISDFPKQLCNFQTFVVSLREHWNKYYREEPTITFGNPISDVEREKVFEVSEHYLHVLFDNIMSNIFKHSVTVGGVEFEFRMNSLFIKISSQSKKDTYPVIAALSKYFAVSERSEEVVRTSYTGIHLIKSHADKLGAVVRTRCLSADLTVVWEIQFKEFSNRAGGDEDSRN